MLSDFSSVLSETRQCGSAIRDRGYPAHAVVPGVMTHIVVRSERRVAACDAPSVTALAGYGQQRTIIDFVRYASLSEEKISVKLRDRIAAGPGDEPANCHIIAQLMLSGERTTGSRPPVIRKTETTAHQRQSWMRQQWQAE